MGHLSQVSMRGLFIETQDFLPIGTITELMLEAPGSAIRAKAAVRHVISGKGMGLEIVAIQEADKARFQNLLRPIQQSGTHAKPRLEAQPSPAPPASPPTGPEIPEKSTEGPEKQRRRERRAHRRHIVAASVRIIEVESGNHLKARLVNLGPRGCFVKTETDAVLKGDLKVEITKGAHSFSAKARVVRSLPGNGMGLQFTSIEPAQEQILDSWMANSLEAAWMAANRRKGQRIALEVPVHIIGLNSRGTEIAEETSTQTISENGALVVLSMTVTKGQRLMMRNPRTNEVAECRVVFVTSNKTNQYDVGLSFSHPQNNFWRVAFPPSDWSPHHPDAKRAKQTPST